MSEQVFDKGDLVRVTARYASNGVSVDPTSVVFKVKTPGGSVTTETYGTDANVQRDAAGVYFRMVDVTETGQWYCRWVTGGSYQSAVEGGFYVRGTQF